MNHKPTKANHMNTTRAIPQKTIKREFLDPNEIAIMVGLAPATIRKHLRSGAISGVRFGSRRWRIPRSEVDKMIACVDVA